MILIASAPEDSATAGRLAELMRVSGLSGSPQCVAIDDETALEAMLEQDRDGTSTYVLLLSRALSERVHSLDALDALLGSLLLGHRRVLATCLAGAAEPSAAVMRLARRHDAITGEATIELAVRRVVGRIARVQIHAPSTAGERRSAAGSSKLRVWLIATIVVLVVLLIAVYFKSLGKG